MEHVSVRPVRIRRRDDHLDTMVVRVVAYRGSCSCSWRGPARDDYRVAKTDARDHKQEAH